MQRPSAVFPVQSEAPAAIESRALGTLAYIRASIESSSSMDVPGMAGIVMGTIGILTAVLVSLPGLAPHWLAIWLVAAALAFLFGGALVALDAYHHSLGNNPAPVIDGLNGDQRFFLSYAQSWRHKSTDDSIRQQIVSNPHAPVNYRVNGVVRNMDAWYRAFNVKPNDKLFLAPENRVRIW